MFTSNLKEVRKNCEDMKDYRIYRFGDTLSKINDSSRCNSSQFYLGEVLDENENYWLIREDIYFSIFNPKEETYLTVNYEEESLEVLATIWEFLTGKDWNFKEFED